MCDEKQIVKTRQCNNRRLFRVHPSEIVEHPDTLPTNVDAIPDGPITGWDCYAPSHNATPGLVLGPFEAVVSRPYDDSRPCIEVVAGSKFWFHEDDDCGDLAARDANGIVMGEAGPRPNWYQSGTTLRFVRRKGNPVI